MINKSMSLNYKCGYCGKEFAKEKTLTVHVCEKKRRHLSRTEKHVQAALMAYQKFYQMAQKNTKEKTFDDFVDSPYYNAFVKFGSFLVNANPLYPERFIDFVIRSGVKLDHWCRDELYDHYLVDLIKSEPADGAIQRSIATMMDWAEQNNSQWEHYFLYVNLNKATYDIKEGQISPWVVLNCGSGRNLLQKMNTEQLEIITPILDPDHWARRFKNYPADFELVKEVLKEANVK
jgi:DNA-directed RNA polymerase subunit RPC12/RpoP